MKRSTTRSWLLLAAVGAGCADPVADERVEALGGEDPAVAPGPLHRPGEPCGACHREDGGARRAFSLSGTVFRDPRARVPATSTTVRFIDATGAQHTAHPNAAGNFYLTPDEFAPVWPVWMKLESCGSTAEMTSASSREGSCAACHADPAGPKSVGHVYVSAAGGEGGGSSCD